MRSFLRLTGWRGAALLAATVSAILAPKPRAEEPPKGGERRLTFEQDNKAGRTVAEKLDQALRLFSEGKPAEAVPVVKEVIVLEREVLREAARNPVEVERPSVPRGLGIDLPEHPPPRTLLAFEAESLRSLELLEQLHEALGDYAAAKTVSSEVAEVIARLTGAGSWQAAQAGEDVERLGRLAAMAPDRARAIEAARKATALLGTAKGPLGTAFCVDPQGIFLTLDEVVDPPSAQVTVHFEFGQYGELAGTREELSPQTMPMLVVLNLGRADATQLPVRVLWRDRRSRLVLLKAETKEALPALELADGRGVAVGAEAVALGLAFVGRLPGLLASSTPTVRTRPGRVTSIRERGGQPWFFQLDTSPPHGYAGGPVLDEQGRVIGVIVGGLPGADVHYILPVDPTSVFAVDFEPPPLLYRHRHAPADWAVHLLSKAPLGTAATVEIRLGTGAAGRPFPARPTGERDYTARVVPVAAGEADEVGLTLEAKPEPIRATVADREVRVGGTAVRLSELRRIEQGPSPRALAADGRRLVGPVTGLGVLQGRRGKESITVDTGRAAVVALEYPAADAEPVEAEVVVKVGEKVLGRVRESLDYADPPIEASGRIDPATGGLTDPLRPAGGPAVPMAVASVSREPRPEARDHPLGGVHCYSAAFSPDGRLYADGGDDNVIRLFDAATGRTLRTITLDSWAQSVDFSPDSRTLLATAFHKQIHLYEVETGRHLRRFETPPETDLDQAVLSPDGLLALSVHASGKLLLWDVQAGLVLRRPAETSWACGFCFTPDGRRMLTASDGPAGHVLRLSDARSGAVAWTTPGPGVGRPVFVGCEAAGTDRFYAAYGNGTIVWGRLTDGKAGRRLALPNPIRDRCVALSPDGRRLLTGHPDNALRLWDVPGGTLVERYALESVPTGQPRFSPDGEFVIANSFRGRLIYRKVPPPPGASPPVVRPLPGTMTSLAVGGAGRYLLMPLKGKRQLAIFDAERADLSGVVELADDDALVTTNAVKGFVAYPSLRIIDRIDLKSARVDRSRAFPFEATPRALVAGSASAGPLLTVFQAGPPGDTFARPVVGFLDPDTLSLVAPRAFRSKVEKNWAEVAGPVLEGSEFAKGKQEDYHASASGDLFCKDVAKTPSLVLALRGDLADVFEVNLSGGALPPATSGRSRFTKTGRFDLAGSPLASPTDPGSILGMFPTDDPPDDPSFYLIVRRNTDQALQGKPVARVLEVDSTATDRRLFVVNGLDEMKGGANPGEGLDQRYHWFPSARLLVTIPAENDRLVLRRLDVLGELDRLEIDEVVVTSPSVVGAVAGEPFRHRVEAHARGGATFEPSGGPESLSVTPEGELRWDVPRDTAGQEHVAVVAVRSASGQTVSHKVHILVRKGR